MTGRDLVVLMVTHAATLLVGLVIGRWWRFQGRVEAACRDVRVTYRRDGRKTEPTRATVIELDADVRIENERPAPIEVTDAVLRFEPREGDPVVVDASRQGKFMMAVGDSVLRIRGEPLGTIRVKGDSFEDVTVGTVLEKAEVEAIRGGAKVTLHATYDFRKRLVATIGEIA